MLSFYTSNAYAQTPQYDFRVWPANSWINPGYWESIQGTICPSPNPDPNTPISTKVYIGLPPWAATQANMSSFLRESNIIPLCGHPQNITSIRPNFTGNYPIYAVSSWIQNGKNQTIQSNDTQFLAIETCPYSYVAPVDSQRYHPGDTITIKIISPVLGCMHLPATIGITVFNTTEDGTTENILSKQSVQIVNETWFNYTIPKQTNIDGLLHFLVRLTWTDSNGNQAEQDLQYVSIDLKKSIQAYNSGNFTTWVDPSSLVNDSSTKLISKICPFVPATDENREEKKDPTTGLITDPGSFILLNYNITKPDGSKEVKQGELRPYDNCNNSWDSQVIDANMIGTWSSYVTAQWMENNTLHTMEAGPVKFEVRVPLFQNNHIDQMNVTNILTMSHTPLSEKPRFDVMDWNHDGKHILLNYRDYHDPPGSYLLHLAILNLDNNNLTGINLPVQNNTQAFLRDAKFSQKGDSLYFLIGGNLYFYDLKNKTSVQLTDRSDIAWIQVLHNGDLAYSEKLPNQNDSINVNYNIWKAHPNGTRISELFQGQNVGYFELSPDNKRIAMVVEKGLGCMYCAYTEAQVVDLDTKQVVIIPHLYNPVEGKWSPAGDLIIWHSNAGYEVPGGSLTITDTGGGFQETLFSGYDNPTSFVISPDGSSIIYGLDYHSCCAEAAGLYQMHLVKAIPEFPFAIPVLLGSITLLIVFHRIKSV